MEYRSLSTYWKEKFGGKVYKLSLQSGCTCPNRDGSIGRGGCIFCSEGGSGDFAAHYAPIQEQITEARKRVDHKFPKGAQPMYMAYFQSYTNTYGNVDRLRSLYLETIQLPEIVGISIGTRPDCLPIEILEMLSELNQIKPVTVELGLQTVHKSSADYIRRGYDLEVFEKVYQDLSNRGIEVVAHVILGLPGESREDMLETIDYLARLQPTLPGIKLQLLHILEGTQLAEDYRRNPFPVFTIEEYTDLVVECLKHLPRETVVHRLTGDGPKSLLIEPKWSGDKKKVLNLLQKKITAAPG